MYSRNCNTVWCAALPSFDMLSNWIEVRYCKDFLYQIWRYTLAISTICVRLHHAWLNLKTWSFLPQTRYRFENSIGYGQGYDMISK